jgi:septal ring factor EnvC (AmiA/AmiB activator)
MGAVAAVLLWCASVCSHGVYAQERLETPPDDEASRLSEVRFEISRLQEELQKMKGREQGLLGELERLGAEMTLRERESEEVALQLAEVTEAIERHDATLNRLGLAQSDRRDYLAFRLREIYKTGPNDWIRRVIEGESVEGYWKALNYAAYLSQRDRDVLFALRRDEQLSTDERRSLDAARERLAKLQAQVQSVQARLSRSRRERTAALARLRQDQTVHREALQELELAAEQLTTLVDSLPGDVGRIGLDIQKFRGLLDWPVEGLLGAGFGTKIHPRFKTEVPHPGWDIEAASGAAIQSVFEGDVVFAAWMRGYGLTAIIDHGTGVLSIYAHASVLLVAKGERVSRGQMIGMVGETGSLRGPYLYFELRQDGKPTDPAQWLRSH